MMEKSVPLEEKTTLVGFVTWEEVFVSNDRGRREVHYFLKRRDGSSDLAVIGKEKSLRHMSYRYALRSSITFPRLKSRREVIDWLKSVVSDSTRDETPCPSMGFLDSKDACQLNTETMKDSELCNKLGQVTREFCWLGYRGTCSKKRRHYGSFCRNSFKISVEDFVYILAEENKCLIAYLEDMYEDSRGNKMVVVQWFHKIDEVGIVLPKYFNDREILFSRCLQDLSVECIDGLATVLSPQHFDKFLNEARHTRFEPFVCQNQFENDDIKPFDITQVNGYWKQEIFRHMGAPNASKALFCPHCINTDENVDVYGSRPKKRHCHSIDGDVKWQCINRGELNNVSSFNEKNLVNSLDESKSGVDASRPKGYSDVAFLPSKPVKQNSSWYLSIGSLVEVLSQDSGIRGLWFRAQIIKKRKDKVKLRYQDMQDADDESKNLEEWILASRVAATDHLGIRISGRSKIRPPPEFRSDRVHQIVDVGMVVDAWCHDGWWEGIVIQKEAGDRFHVYFPGENHTSVFSRGDLRHSEEWLGNRWIKMERNPDIATRLLLCHRENIDDKLTHCDNRQSSKDDPGFSDPWPCLDAENDNFKELGVVPDLSKDNLLANLKWNTSRKRRRRSSEWSLKKYYNDDNSEESLPLASDSCKNFLMPRPLKGDHVNSKYLGDSVFVPSLTNLVMSR